MGKTHQAEEDNPNRLKVPLSVRSKLYGLLYRLGFSIDQLPSQEKLDNLLNNLNEFRCNYGRWRAICDLDNVLRRHLAFTLLVPGGKADRARFAVDVLHAQGCLTKPLKSRVVAKMIRPYVRFHNVKARRLVTALRLFPRLQNQVLLHTGLKITHDWIVKHIKGLGRKATAHFMRNTGIWSDRHAYPLIDVHIHKVLEAFNFKHSTYSEAEQSFWNLAEFTGLDIIFLDAVLWCTYANNWNFSNSDFDNFGACS